MFDPLSLLKILVFDHISAAAKRTVVVNAVLGKVFSFIKNQIINYHDAGFSS